jgi:anti-sigma regulatory factor (Ser/Thr protein kinase)
VTETLVLTLPNEERFLALIRLVVGGFASKLDLPYEQMDELQLAVETVLSRAADHGVAVTLRVEAQEHGISVSVRPVDEMALRDVHPDRGGLGLGQILSTLVHSVEVITLGGEQWLRLAQSIPSKAPASG